MKNYLEYGQTTSMKDFPIRENMHILNVVDISILMAASARLIASSVVGTDINLERLAILTLVKVLCFLLLNVIKLGIIATIININKFTKKDISFLHDLNEDAKLAIFAFSHILSCLILLFAI